MHHFIVTHSLKRHHLLSSHSQLKQSYGDEKLSKESHTHIRYVVIVVDHIIKWADMMKIDLCNIALSFFRASSLWLACLASFELYVPIPHPYSLSLRRDTNLSKCFDHYNRFMALPPTYYNYGIKIKQARRGKNFIFCIMFPPANVTSLMILMVIKKLFWSLQSNVSLKYSDV